MKSLALLAVSFLLAPAAQASGSFECQTADKALVVSGLDSSAGTSVRAVRLNGKNLVEDKDYQRSQLYNGARAFQIRLMDDSYNKTLVLIETVKAYPLAAGLAWINEEEEARVVSCEFSY